MQGRLVAIIGPSGAGKDTLLGLASAHLAARRDVIFARRVITRPAEPNEPHEPADEAEFLARCAAGGFALHWAANGLRYGIPVSVEAEIARGRHVVASLSRTVVAEARARYPAFVIEITAPSGLLRERLLRRGREGAGDIKARLARSAAIDAGGADAVIVNDAAAEDAGLRLAALIGGQ